MNLQQNTPQSTVEVHIEFLHAFIDSWSNMPKDERVDDLVRVYDAFLKMTGYKPMSAEELLAELQG